MKNNTLTSAEPTVQAGPVNPQPRKKIISAKSIFKNKYLLALAAFFAVMLLPEKNNFFTQISRTRQLNNLKQSKQYYNTQIESERKELQALQNDPATLERYAREKYLMKRDDEELFLVPENYDQPKK